MSTRTPLNSPASPEPTISQNYLELSDDGFADLVGKHQKFRERSHNTHTDTHQVELAALQSPLDIVFIGDSNLERLKTTGESTQVARLPRTFNAGVGGDKIANLLYRISIGLLGILPPPKLWVVTIGTNDIHPKRGFAPEQGTSFKILLAALLRHAPESQILATAINYRTDIERTVVDQSNAMLMDAVGEMNEAIAGNTLYWLWASPELNSMHFFDHVHLNEEGYQVWDKLLYPKVEKLVHG